MTMSDDIFANLLPSVPEILRSPRCRQVHCVDSGGGSIFEVLSNTHSSFAGNHRAILVDISELSLVMHMERGSIFSHVGAEFGEVMGPPRRTGGRPIGRPPVRLCVPRTVSITFTYGSIFGILPGRAASCTDESGDVSDRLHQMVQLTRADVPIAY